MKRYSGQDIKRALDCVNMTHAGDVIMLRVRRSAAADALANYIFDLDDPNRTSFLERANAPLQQRITEPSPIGDRSARLPEPPDLDRCGECGGTWPKGSPTEAQNHRGACPRLLTRRRS